MVTVLSVILTLLDFIAPGLAWIMLTGIAKRLSFLGQAAFSLLFSICFLSLLAASFSVLTVDYLFYAGLLPLTSLVFIAAQILRADLRSLKPRVRKEGLPVMFILLIYCIVLLSSFWSAPFYPNTMTLDPVTHVQIVASILQGNGGNVLLRSGYPTGLHFAAAELASLTSLTAMQSLRTLLSLVVLAVFIIAYESAQVTFGSKRSGIFVALVAAFAIPVDPTLLISLGFYPNLLADAIILMTIWGIFSYVAQPSRKLGVTLGFLALAGVFVHTSVLLFLGGVWIFTPVVYFLFRPKFRSYMKAALYLVSILALFAVILLPFYGRDFARVQAYSELGRPMTAHIFASVYLTLWITFTLYGGTVAVGAVVASIILFAFHYRDHLGQLLLTVWMSVLMVGAFFSSEQKNAPWRFALFALVPGYLLVGSLISYSSKLEISKTSTKKIAQALPIAALLILIAASPFSSLVARAYNPATREREAAIIDSMQWLSQNGCADGVVSVGLGSDYPYLPALTGIRYFGDYEEPATAVLNQSYLFGFHCVAVSTQDSSLSTFGSTSVFVQEYKNEFVVIFIIKH